MPDGLPPGTPDRGPLRREAPGRSIGEDPEAMKRYCHYCGVRIENGPPPAIGLCELHGIGARAIVDMQEDYLLAGNRLAQVDEPAGLSAGLPEAEKAAQHSYVHAIGEFWRDSAGGDLET